MYRIGIMTLGNMTHFVSQWPAYVFANSDMKTEHFLNIFNGSGIVQELYMHGLA